MKKRTCRRVRPRSTGKKRQCVLNSQKLSVQMVLCRSEPIGTVCRCFYPPTLFGLKKKGNIYTFSDVQINISLMPLITGLESGTSSIRYQVKITPSVHYLTCCVLFVYSINKFKLFQPCQKQACQPNCTDNAAFTSYLTGIVWKNPKA